MKGLALAIVLALACIQSNTDGMRVSVNVGINSSDEPGKHLSKIVGGEKVEPHSIPWQVFLGFNRSAADFTFCGGTIICPRFVMSAAQCTAPGSSYKIYIGVHRVPADFTEDNLHVVKKAHVHPKNGAPNNYDYAIMELMNPISITAYAKAIFLPDGSEKYNDKSLFLTSGWGETSNGGYLSDVLLSVTLPFVPHEVCKDIYYNPPLTPQQMCAGDIDKGKIDTCWSDIGGPLAWLDPKTDQVKLSGVVSLTWCAPGVPGKPGVYADVFNQLEWIKEVTENCNEQTCQAGNCMRKQNLHRETIAKFGRITPYPVQEAPVKEYITGEGHNARYLAYGKK